MRIGIIGSGQLGRMLALAAIPLGITPVFFDEQAGTACTGLGTICTGPYDDESALSDFASQCDAVTYEFENIPAETARIIGHHAPIYPPPRALEVSQDRIVEKRYLSSLGIKTPRFTEANSAEELALAIEEIGTPCVVKTRRFGYDGKGQAVIRSTAEMQNLWKILGETPLIVEEFLAFSRELSVIGCRDRTGSIVVYPPVQNVHRDGILFQSTLPAPEVSKSLASSGTEIISKLLTDLEYVGVLTIELFEVNGECIANEIAPRVHNSGHATIDGSITSQFENHVRAVCGLPLGITESRGTTVMYNLIGSIPPLESLAAIEGAKVHLYGKAPRPGRKVGHVTLTHNTEEILRHTEALLVPPAVLPAS